MVSGYSLHDRDWFFHLPQQPVIETQYRIWAEFLRFQESFAWSLVSFKTLCKWALPFKRQKIVSVLSLRHLSLYWHGMVIRPAPNFSCSWSHSPKDTVWSSSSSFSDGQLGSNIGKHTSCVGVGKIVVGSQRYHSRSFQRISKVTTIMKAFPFMLWHVLFSDGKYKRKSTNDFEIRLLEWQNLLWSHPRDPLLSHQQCQTRKPRVRFRVLTYHSPRHDTKSWLYTSKWLGRIYSTTKAHLSRNQSPLHLWKAHPFCRLGVTRPILRTSRTRSPTFPMARILSTERTCTVAQ